MRTKSLHDALANLAEEAAELAAAAARLITTDQSMSRAAVRIREARLMDVFKQRNDVDAVMNELITWAENLR